jgi:hypothetical protein
MGVDLALGMHNGSEVRTTGQEDEDLVMKSERHMR